ncbi:MAG: ATP-binding protein [Xanthobacteraceae bacterium]
MAATTNQPFLLRPRTSATVSKLEFVTTALEYLWRSRRKCSTRSLRQNLPVKGTGLGLSISHDIIVKQHSGSIEVDTKPGEFTEFRIILPRAGMAPTKQGERA